MEIKFRGQRVDTREWVYGYYAERFNNDHTIYVSEIHNGDLFCAAYPVIPKTVGQYIGLKDMNGKKIYKGDIVRCTDENNGIKFTAIVEFGNPNHLYSWGYQLRRLRGDEPNLDTLLWIGMEETGAFCEIIGNAYDNPELL